MLILFDAHMIGERETGNEVYAVSLLRGFRETGHSGDVVAAVSSEEAAGRLQNICRTTPVSSNPFVRLVRDLPREFRRHGADLLHVTYFGPFWTRIPGVVTVHDIAYRHHPEWFSLRDRAVLGAGIPPTMRWARRIITVSDFCREDIARSFGIPADKIAVTPEAGVFAAEPDRSGNSGAFRLPDRPYALYVGNIQPRKNLGRLLEAFAMIVRGGASTCDLVIAGQAAYRAAEIRRKVESLGIADRTVFTGYVSDNDLVTLYRGARCLVYVPLFEGFGLPVAEAMALDVPVVTSNVTSLPEVSGGAACLVDPLSVESIRDGIARVLLDDVYRSSLIEAGRKRSGEMKWSLTAAKTWSVYETAAASTPASS